MSTSEERRLSTVEEELLRLACDDLATPSEEVREYLEADPTRAEEQAATRAFVASLRAAIEPQSFDVETERRILARAGSTPAATPTLRLSWLRVVGVAAAAAVVACLWFPLGGSELPETAPAGGVTIDALTQQDAAAIARAYALVGWEGTQEVSTEYIETRVAELESRLGLRSGDASDVEWDGGDAWDMPIIDDDASRVPVKQGSVT